jgi:signal transduction histidine kinase
LSPHAPTEEPHDLREKGSAVVREIGESISADPGMLVQEARETLLRGMTVVFFIFGFLTYLWIAPLMVADKRYALLTLFPVFFITMLVINLRGQFSYRGRAFQFLATMFITGSLATMSDGYVMGAGLLLATTVVAAGLLLGGRAAVVSVVAVMVVLGIVGYGFVSGQLIVSSATDVHRFQNWVGSGCVLLWCCALIVVAVGFMFRKLEQSLRTSTMLVKELQEQILRREETQAQLHRTEEQLHHAQKMEAIGRLAGGIAHDFNNTLTVILGQTEVLQHSLRHDEDLLEAAKDIELAALRAAQLTRQLLVFSRRDVTRFQWVDPNATTRETVRVIRRLLGAQVQVETRLARDLPGLIVDEAQLQNAILNLAINARDAMPLGGTLTLETSLVSFKEPSTDPPLPAGKYICFVVRDTGVGMDKETREKIFEPFFTTKGAGRGTGLGLATLFSFVQQNKGHVMVESEPGKGSTFTVMLPATDDPPPPENVHDSQNLATGNETILVVDDDIRVRALMCTALADSGYRVLEAPNGQEAMDLLARLSEHVHMVITDVVMPQADGRALAEHVRQKRPDTKILLCSGYSGEEAVRRDIREGEYEHIQKPFTGAVLLRKVRQLLDGVPTPILPQRPS